MITTSKPTKRGVDGNTRRANTNVAASANQTTTAHINITATNAKVGANIAVTTNANKTASNTKEHVPIYWQTQMLM